MHATQAKARGSAPGPRRGALPLGSPPRAAALGTRPLVLLREGSRGRGRHTGSAGMAPPTATPLPQQNHTMSPEATASGGGPGAEPLAFAWVAGIGGLTSWR